MSQQGKPTDRRAAATPEALSNLIVQLRREKGMTQQALADRMGMRQPTVSKLERDPRASRVDTVFRALTALGLQLAVVERTDSSLDETPW